MISRILVPKDARPAPPAPDAVPRRLSSQLDERSLVPTDLPHVELSGRSEIPAYLRLDVLGDRTVVPRDMPLTPLDATSSTPSYVPLSILDSRVAVPKDAHAGELIAKPLVSEYDLPDVIDPDVLTTGEVHLMAHPVEEKTAAWNAVARAVSIGLHFLVLLLIFFGPNLFPSRKSTQEEIARQDVTSLYLPNDVRDVPKSPVTPQPRSPQMRVDPRLLRRLAPPREMQPNPGPPEPDRVVRDTPASKPNPESAAPSAPPAAQPKQPAPESPVRPPPNETASNGLVLPRFSPGRALQESLHEALKEGGSSSAQFGGPSPGGGGIGPGGGGGGQGYMGGNVEILTPTEGVDFSNYIARVLASVKRNWYAVMPESARLGDRGRVVLQFHIMRNGVVPDAEPAMAGTSGKDPLDRAAVSAIRSSTPFEPLPPAFSGPYIELRFIFLYNLPLSSQ
jgi:TonB family protein